LQRHGGQKYKNPVGGRLLTVGGRQFVNNFTIELLNDSFADVLSLHKKLDLMKFALHKITL